MRTRMVNWISLLVCCGATAVWAESHFTTPLRVLLQRSPQGVALRNTLPATVRINDQLKPAKLPPGPLVFAPEGAAKLRMVRVPYRPLVADSVDLLWPLESAGLEWKAKKYRGRARFVVRDGEIFALNLLPLEPYLAGTVGGEMSASWSLEALKAQAVAARSYALHRKQFPRHPFFDLDSTTEDQVYLGVSGESPRTWSAVRGTEGVYLASKGKAASIHYHSRCGGETETAQAVWGTQNSHGQRVPCAFCRQSPYHWSAVWSPEEFSKKLGLKSWDNLSVATVPARSGRVQEVEVSARGERRRLSSETLRRALGYSTLKSSQFVMSRSEAGIRAEGVGAGHGVGMCQWGAKYLAEKGSNYLEILTHYYPTHSLARWAPEKGVDRSTVAGVGYAHDRPSRLRFSAAGNPNRAFPRYTP